jgi:hypothetical protein
MFMLDLASRLSNRVQLTSDAHGAYLRAVEGAFGHDIDYAQLQKLYGETSESEKRYSPATCIGCKRQEMIGYPDPKHISTSFVERHNLSVRMMIGATLASRMLFPARLRITRLRSHSATSRTTSSKFIAPCA